MDARQNKLAAALAALSVEDRGRLARLAITADSTPEEIWPAVYRYGFDDMEQSVQADRDAEADIAAGRTMSHDDVMKAAWHAIDSHAQERKRRAG